MATFTTAEIDELTRVLMNCQALHDLDAGYVEFEVMRAVASDLLDDGVRLERPPS